MCFVIVCVVKVKLTCTARLVVWGKYEEAESLHQHVLEGRQREFGLNNEDTLSTLNHLGMDFLG
jgi:hypothetical protein